MLGVITKIPDANPSIITKGRQETNPVDATSAVENSRIRRLEFMKWEERFSDNLFANMRIAYPTNLFHKTDIIFEIIFQT